MQCKTGKFSNMISTPLIVLFDVVFMWCVYRKVSLIEVVPSKKQRNWSKTWLIRLLVIKLLPTCYIYIAIYHSAWPFLLVVLAKKNREKMRIEFWILCPLKKCKSHFEFEIPMNVMIVLDHKGEFWSSPKCDENENSICIYGW